MMARSLKFEDTVQGLDIFVMQRLEGQPSVGRYQQL